MSSEPLENKRPSIMEICDAQAGSTETSPRVAQNLARLANRIDTAMRFEEIIAANFPNNSSKEIK